MNTPIRIVLLLLVALASIVWIDPVGAVIGACFGLVGIVILGDA